MAILFLVVFLSANKNNLLVYTQILWITLCISCYIPLLTPVFNTFLLDCTKNRQSIITGWSLLFMTFQEIFMS